MADHHHVGREAAARGARMLRTALGPAVAGFLDDPSIVELMLNPDGRLWVDRLKEGLCETGKHLNPADGERIVRLVAHHVGAEVHSGSPRVSAELPEGCRRSFQRPTTLSASRPSPCSRSHITPPLSHRSPGRCAAARFASICRSVEVAVGPSLSRNAVRKTAKRKVRSKASQRVSIRYYLVTCVGHASVSCCARSDSPAKRQNAGLRERVCSLPAAR